ncbi:MAG: PQQ-dependent sugar dehydrogenase [Planctomycetota bacterium]
MGQRRSGIGIAAFLGACFAPLIASGAGGQSVRELWRNECASCHGEDGSGGNATSLLDDDWTLGGTYREMYRATAEGLVDLGMPAYEETLSDAEIWGLVAYMEELRARHERRRNPWAGADASGVVRTMHHSYRIETMAEGDLDLPWGVAFASDGSVLITERPGGLRVLADGELTTVDGTPEVWAFGQGGMLDVAVHPEHAENGWVYLSFSERWQENGRDVGMTKVVRGRVQRSDDGFMWADEEVIYEPPRGLGSRTGFHFGTRLVFDDGYLFFSIGDRGRKDDAQDLGRPNGKTHRLHDDGRVPDDNPFVGREGALATVWSYGHRNAQGTVFDPSGRLWVTEHGPRGGDELNLVERGLNFGWPLVSYGINYNGRPFKQPWPDRLDGPDPGITMPEAVWLPSIAVCGLSAGTGGLFPNWEGDLFAGGLAGQIVERIRVDEAGDVIEREPVFRNLGRVRDVKTAPDGSIWIVLNGPNKVVRLAPAG